MFVEVCSTIDVESPLNPDIENFLKKIDKDKKNDIFEKIKIIEKYICNNFEDWDLDDPIAEGYLNDYQETLGASETDIKDFEEKFKISLPNDIKDLYSYKNGSNYFMSNWSKGNGLFLDEPTSYREVEGILPK